MQKNLRKLKKVYTKSSFNHKNMFLKCLRFTYNSIFVCFKSFDFDLQT